MPENSSGHNNNLNRDESKRHSYQPKTNSENDKSPLRHTQSVSVKTKRKRARKITAPTIPEVEDAAEGETFDSKVPSIVIENEKSKHKKKVSRTGSRVSEASNPYVFDNAAFEGGLAISGGTRTSSRNPSIQSLSVVQEQYCCCSRRTKYERYLITAVSILVFILIILVVVIVILAQDKDGKVIKSLKLL